VKKLRKTTKVTNGSWNYARDSNHASPEYKSTAFVLDQRCTSRAQRTVCDEFYCCVVHACTGWNGQARHVAGEGRAAWVIGEKGERTLSERDR
jgi:hypothetical protein